jgi:hypothetical protein
MKRLALFLILTAFLFGISGGGSGPSHAKLQFRASPPAGSQAFICPPFDDVSGNWDSVDQPSLLPGSFALSLEPSWQSLIFLQHLSPITQKYFFWEGLGCGGLPS